MPFMAWRQKLQLTLYRIYRKIDRRILPFVAVIYLLCYLDRSNIGQHTDKTFTIITKWRQATQRSSTKTRPTI
jgi:hypothetical protein